MLHLKDDDIMCVSGGRVEPVTQIVTPSGHVIDSFTRPSSNQDFALLKAADMNDHGLTAVAAGPGPRL